MEHSIYIESPKVGNISILDMKRIFEIERDMWAREEGLGEYIKCNNCSEICSKQDIFGHISREIYSKTVSEIERILNINSITCSECGSHDANYMYSEDKYIQTIARRYSKEAFLILVKNQENDIVGFMDGYVGSLESVFEMELEDHYKDVGFHEIKNAISMKLGGTLPDKIFSCSSMGTIEDFKSMPLIFSMLGKFFNSIPEQYDNLIGITELDFGGNLHAIYSALGATSIGFKDDIRLTNLSNSYNSDLFLQEKLIGTYKQEFSSSIRDFLKRHHHKIKKVKKAV